MKRSRGGMGDALKPWTPPARPVVPQPPAVRAALLALRAKLAANPQRVA